MPLTVRKLIEDPDSDIQLSAASVWEIAIKIWLGKLEVTRGFESVLIDLDNNAIKVIPVTLSHVSVLANLELHHRDPFDRILIAQSISERADLVSADRIFDKYFESTSVKRIW